MAFKVLTTGLHSFARIRCQRPCVGYLKLFLILLLHNVSPQNNSAI